MNSITNLACSILKEFDLPYLHSTLDVVDNFLEGENPENVVVILCDGMGYNILKNTLNEKEFLIKNLKTSIRSVNPSTTTASTTSMLSGLNPCEHGWLGWDLYVKPIDKIVTLFLNSIKDKGVQAETFHVGNKYYSYKNITEQINEKGIYTSKILFPFGDDLYSDFDDMLLRIERETNKPGKKYIYAYYENPDSLLHQFGVGSDESIVEIKKINNGIEELCSRLENTLVIVTADHGHINSSDITLSREPEIFNLLERDIWLEGRFCSFKVLDDKHDRFVELFNKLYSDDFVLKTKQEVIDEKIFGDGKVHELFESSLGDFIAMGKTNKYFRYNEDSVYLKSMHAGITEDEVNIPLIIKMCKENRKDL